MFSIRAEKGGILLGGEFVVFFFFFLFSDLLFGEERKRREMGWWVTGKGLGFLGGRGKRGKGRVGIVWMGF